MIPVLFNSQPTFSIDFPIGLIAAVRVTVHPNMIHLGLLKGLHKEEFMHAERFIEGLSPQSVFEECRADIEKMFADFMHRIDTIDFDKVLSIVPCFTDFPRRGSDVDSHPKQD